nr:hypothetical protein Iba_chr13cCG14690 [Ipomoea batatas]
MKPLAIIFKILASVSYDFFLNKITVWSSTDALLAIWAFLCRYWLAGLCHQKHQEVCKSPWMQQAVGGQ